MRSSPNGVDLGHIRASSYLWLRCYFISISSRFVATQQYGGESLLSGEAAVEIVCVRGPLEGYMDSV